MYYYGGNMNIVPREENITQLYIKVCFYFRQKINRTTAYHTVLTSFSVC